MAAKKIIIFDFDGVILDSLPVRAGGFREVVAEYGPTKQKEFEEFHFANGGMSRFLKFEYFYTNILGGQFDGNLEELVAEKAIQFGEYVKEELTQTKYLITDTIALIKDLFKDNYPLHIVSASDNEELNFLCRTHQLDSYFLSIKGTPPLNKADILINLMQEFGFSHDQCLYIGDSINDFKACATANIPFYGFNNKALAGLDGSVYLDHIRDIYSHLS